MSRRPYWICLVLPLVLSTPFPAAGHQPGDYGDAPEGTLAYPDVGVIGSFPTCYTEGPVGFIYHAPVGSMWFGGPGAYDTETDGNAGTCSGQEPDRDECFDDEDAGLLSPVPYTIRDGDAVSCTAEPPSPLGAACQWGEWGSSLDIFVANAAPMAYVNVLVDWNRDGVWSGISTCPGRGEVPEHLLVNLEVPEGYRGPLSDLLDPSERLFPIGPSGGFVWARFTISDTPVEENWNGEGVFAEGETEDYLLRVEPPTPASSWSWGRIKTVYR